MKRRFGSTGFWIAITLLGIISAMCGWQALLSLKQRHDMTAVREYVGRVQPQLAADSRFKDVRLLGYSCDYVTHPYIPVDGSVASQQDWQALDDFIRASKPPVFISVRTVFVAPSGETPKPR